MKKLVLLAIVWLCMMGCEKDVIDIMQDYYVESQGLQNVTIDSVTTFSLKLDRYVTSSQRKWIIIFIRRSRRISNQPACVSPSQLIQRGQEQLS